MKHLNRDAAWKKSKRARLTAWELVHSMVRRHYDLDPVLGHPTDDPDDPRRISAHRRWINQVHQDAYDDGVTDKQLVWILAAALSAEIRFNHSDPLGYTQGMKDDIRNQDEAPPPEKEY